jgi:hypothetical protein
VDHRKESCEVLPDERLEKVTFREWLKLMIGGYHTPLKHRVGKGVDSGVQYLTIAVSRVKNVTSTLYAWSVHKAYE